jgi:hypothetical protein
MREVSFTEVPTMKRSLSILAGVVATSIRRLARDLRASSAGDTMTGPAQARTLAQDRSEASGALERMADALPEGHARKTVALLQAAVVMLTTDHAKLERQAAEWERWADGGEGGSGVPAAA